MNNEWVIKAEGASAQAFIDHLSCPIDTRAVLAKGTAKIGEDGEILEIDAKREIIDLISGLEQHEMVAPPNASTFLARITLKPHEPAESPRAMSSRT